VAMSCMLCTPIEQTIAASMQPVQGRQPPHMPKGMRALQARIMHKENMIHVEPHTQAHGLEDG
jgi:hypothetical protein